MTIRLTDANEYTETIEIGLDSEGNIVDVNMAPGHIYQSAEIKTAFEDDQFEQRLWDNRTDGEFSIDDVTVTFEPFEDAE